jgi:TRAP-type C4-dicarboxylate transport system substrate-binding protein
VDSFEIDLESERRKWVMRKLSLLALPFVFLSFLIASQVQAQTVWKMAFVAPPPVWGPVAEKYAQIVAQKTNNQFQIKWFGGGQLGNLPQMFAGIKTGQLDMIFCDYGSLSLGKGGKDFNILFALTHFGIRSI